jgi:FkbM family methyltransferase
MPTLLWKIKSRIETYLNSPEKNNYLLNSFLASLSGDTFFIEIGANDGIEADPIYPFVKKNNWSGVYIEPQKKVFEKLKHNFSGHSNVFFENIAITENEEVVTLYIPIAEGKINYSLFASLSPKSGEMSWFERSQIVEEKVPGKPFKYLVDKYELYQKKYVFLLIDVEGQEKQIFNSIDFEFYKPNAILYEHDHLKYSEDRDIKRMLQEKGYKIYHAKYDSLAVLK